MMPAGMLYAVLLVLALSVALNLALTFRLLAAVRALADGPPVPLSAGMPLPPIEGRVLPGRLLPGRAVVALPPAGQPAVLLFLSSRCPKCRAKLPEIAGLLAPAQAAGVAVWLVSHEPSWRLRRFLRASPLAAVAVRVARASYRQLNVRYASPSYLFIGHDGMVQAQGMIGDDDWMSFCAQMDDARQAA